MNTLPSMSEQIVVVAHRLPDLSPILDRTSRHAPVTNVLRWTAWRPEWLIHLRQHPRTSTSLDDTAGARPRIRCVRPNRGRGGADGLQASVATENGTGLAFSREDGTPINPNLVSAWFTRKAPRAGVPPIHHLHDLRHSHASLALQGRLLRHMSLAHRAGDEIAENYRSALRATR